MPTASPARPRIGLALLLVAPLICLLTVLAFLSTMASLSAQPSLGERLDAGEKVPAADLNAVAQAEMNAARWFEPARHDRAAARALLALPAEQRIRHFGEVQGLTEAALRKSPMMAYDWTLMAFLALRRNDVAAADRAWQTSVMFAPYAPELMRARIELGVRIARRDPNIEPALRDQVKLMARDPGGLAAMARDNGLEPYVRSILGKGTEPRKQFESATSYLVYLAVQKARHK